MRVAMFLENGYEEGEAIVTADLLKRANIIVDLISVSNKEVTSCNRFNIKIDINFDRANYQDYQAFILPGGWDQVINLKKSKKLKEWLTNANKEQKIIAAICAGPMALAEFGLLNDKEYTIYPSCLEAVKNIGKINNKLPVIMDGNIITSPSLGCVFPFALKLVEKIHSKNRRLEMENNLLFR